MSTETRTMLKLCTLWHRDARMLTWTRWAWRRLRKRDGLHLCPGFGSVEVSRRIMLLADRRDLRTIWDALGTDIGDFWGGFWSVLGVQEYEDDEGVVGFEIQIGVAERT